MLSFFALALLALPYLNITIDAGLRSDAALPGAPLECALAFDLPADAKDTMLNIALFRDQISLGLLDGNGRLIYDAKPGPKRYGGTVAYFWGTDFADPELQVHRMLVNEWFSTELPPGSYTLVILLSKIDIATKADESTGPGGLRIIHSRGFPVGKRWELPFEILAPDDEAVGKMYAALLADCKDLSPEGKARREHALEFLIYAREPLAVPYQLDLFVQDECLTSIDTGFDANPYDSDLPMRLVESNSPKVAEALVGFFRRLQDPGVAMNESYRQRIANTVIWILHQLHQQGNPEVVKITQSIVEAHPNPQDPRPHPGYGI